MSAGREWGWDEARHAAETVRTMLAPACERIEIAGSIRRRVPMVHDIELVAVPRVESIADLWGDPTATEDLLESALRILRVGERLTLREVESHRKDGSVTAGQRDGPSYKALEFEGIPVDLFIVRPPADWGVIFAIRTGPADFGHRIVTDCQRYLRRVYRSGQYIPCPEEADFFEAVGQEWVEPADRSAARVRIRARAGIGS